MNPMEPFTEAEYQEHIAYDRGYSDGKNGNAANSYQPVAGREKYAEGFRTGRTQLRQNYQRGLLNDYGPVSYEA